MRDTVAPFFGTSSTLTLHVPVDAPRTADPTNTQRDAPDTLLMRIVPCDFRGMASPAAVAIVAADAVRPRRTVTRRLGRAVEVTVPEGDAVAIVDVVTAEVVVAGGTVTGDAVVGVEVAGGEVVGGTVLGTVVGTDVGTVVVAAVTESNDTVAGASREV
ncbi:MAG: hypothetical protein ACKODP_05440 [Actinomycetota bacterium]